MHQENVVKSNNMTPIQVSNNFLIEEIERLKHLIMLSNPSDKIIPIMDSLAQNITALLTANPNLPKIKQLNDLKQAMKKIEFDYSKTFFKSETSSTAQFIKSIHGFIKNNEFSAKNEIERLLPHLINKPFTKTGIYTVLENIAEAVEVVADYCGNYPDNVVPVIDQMLKFTPKEYKERICPALINAWEEENTVERLKAQIFGDSLYLLCRFANNDEKFIESTYYRHFDMVHPGYIANPSEDVKSNEGRKALFTKMAHDIALDCLHAAKAHHSLLKTPALKATPTSASSSGSRGL